MLYIFFALQLARVTGGNFTWTFEVPSSKARPFCSVWQGVCDANWENKDKCTLRISYTELFSLPDEELPIECERRGRGLYWDHIVCMRRFKRQNYICP